MAATTDPTLAQTKDDWLTVCAISVLSGIVGNVLHEGLGHAATALLTGAKSGVLSTVAWSSAYDSRLVAAGGTLANLAAGNSGLLWLKYYIPKGTVPERSSDAIARNYSWIAAAIVLSIPFIFVLGRGITLHRWLVL